MRYDVEQARIVARQISRVSGDIGQLASGQVRRVQIEANEALVGDAGTTLDNQLVTLNQQMLALEDGLNQIVGGLNRYIRRLEEMDKRMMAFIGKS